jgi:hypothetical protein
MGMMVSDEMGSKRRISTARRDQRRQDGKERVIPREYRSNRNPMTAARRLSPQVDGSDGVLMARLMCLESRDAEAKSPAREGSRRPDGV